MNYPSLQDCLIRAIFFALILASPIVQAQPSSAPSANPSSSPLVKPDADSRFGERLTGLEQEVQKLRKPQKDIWDKLSAISGLLLALVGLVVTYVLNERNRITAEEQKQREIAVLQVQTVQSFMPQLQSGGPKEVEAALLAIFALDQGSKLATDLASLYRNEGAISALRKIASGTDVEAAKLAQKSLAEMITVSMKQFSNELQDLSLSVNSLGTFSDLTNQVFWGLKGAVDAFTYERSWILKDLESGREFRKLRKKDGNPAIIDTRSLKEVGIEPGMTLVAEPIVESRAEAGDQQVK